MSDNPKLKKNGGEGTKFGNFLRKIKGKVLPTVLDAVGVGDFAKAIGIISDDPNNAGLSNEEAHKFFELVELEMQDRASARIMQTKIATSRNSGWFARNYVYLLSTLIILAAIIFGVSLMFTIVPQENKRIIEMFADIFLFSGALTIINFFFGASIKENKQKL